MSESPPPRDEAVFTTKSDLAYTRVRALILSGELAPGAVLPQAALARTIGMSTTPLREALRRLKQEGLVELDAHRDARVRPLDATEARDLLELRRSLEPLAAELAAQRRTRVGARGDAGRACAPRGASGQPVTSPAGEPPALPRRHPPGLAQRTCWSRCSTGSGSRPTATADTPSRVAAATTSATREPPSTASSSRPCGTATPRRRPSSCATTWRPASARGPPWSWPSRMPSPAIGRIQVKAAAGSAFGGAGRRLLAPPAAALGTDPGGHLRAPAHDRLPGDRAGRAGRVARGAHRQLRRRPALPRDPLRAGNGPLRRADG